MQRIALLALVASSIVAGAAAAQDRSTPPQEAAAPARGGETGKPLRLYRGATPPDPLLPPEEDPPDPPWCGDGLCGGAESCATCPGDCLCGSGCGDGVCGEGESGCDCAFDCGPCDGCGDGVCDAMEDGVFCPGDCPGVPPAPPDPSCTGMNLRNLPLASCDRVGPQPTAGGDCNCVVRIDTTRRTAGGPGLFQECDGGLLGRSHYGHGSCPRCRDRPHTSPTGNWGVEVGAAVLASPLSFANATGASGAQDGLQWPGPIGTPCACGPCLQWNTCACDPQHFAANPPSLGRYRAGWFRVQSASPTCEPLAQGALSTLVQLFLWELDPSVLGLAGEDDLIASIQTPVAFTGFACDPATGRCTASATVPLADPTGTVGADGVLEVECRGRPYTTCPSQCGGAVTCGTDACGNDCGACPPGQFCAGGHCQTACLPCLGQECGFDLACSSGQWCGSCPPGQQCSAGSCWPSCLPCQGQTCGFDLSCGSGTWCGDCEWPFVCNAWGGCEDTSVCVLDCGDGVCCNSEMDPSSGFYCPGDCWGGGGGGGGGDGGGNGCNCDCDGDGWVSEAECVGGCGGTVAGGFCWMD